MTSAAEAELRGLYINAWEEVHIRNILSEMGYPQPRTPIQTDNYTADGVVNNKILPKATKAMDIRFHWLRCRQAQKNSDSSGGQGHQIKEIIQASTTQGCTIEMCVQIF